MAQPTDRELLELAAQAFWGSEIDDVCSIRWLEEDQAIGYTHGDNQDHNGIDREFVWNPLTDDGDSRRLQVNLALGLVPIEDGGWACITWDHDDQVTLAADLCPRRAVVRAAAAKVKGGAL